MGDLGGYKICGKKDSTPFLTAVRGQSDGSGCSTNNGYIPCNPDSDPENMICVLERDLQSCPITNLELFSSLNDLNEFLIENDGYEVSDDPTLTLQGIKLSKLTPNIDGSWTNQEDQSVLTP